MNIYLTYLQTVEFSCEPPARKTRFFMVYRIICGLFLRNSGEWDFIYEIWTMNVELAKFAFPFTVYFIFIKEVCTLKIFQWKYPLYNKTKQTWAQWDVRKFSEMKLQQIILISFN